LSMTDQITMQRANDRLSAFRGDPIKRLISDQPRLSRQHSQSRTGLNVNSPVRSSGILFAPPQTTTPRGVEPLQGSDYFMTTY